MEQTCVGSAVPMNLHRKAGPQVFGMASYVRIHLEGLELVRRLFKLKIENPKQQNARKPKEAS